MTAQPQFEIGCKVHLRVAPHGEPGIVQGHSRGRIEVDFPSLGYAGRFKPESLVLHR